MGRKDGTIHRAAGQAPAVLPDKERRMGRSTPLPESAEDLSPILKHGKRVNRMLGGVDQKPAGA
jgi:hypothetical protein